MSVGEITPKKQLFTRPTDFFDSLKDRQLTVFQRVDKLIGTLADFEKGR